MNGASLTALSPHTEQPTQIVFSPAFAPYTFSVWAIEKEHTVVSPTVFNSASLPTRPETINFIIIIFYLQIYIKLYNFA
jgi:hypothetical protein